MITYLLEHNRYMNLIGIAVILGIALLMSKKRNRINLSLVMNALLLQFAIGFTVLKTGFGQAALAAVAGAVGRFYSFAEQGVHFVFGALADPQGPWGFVFAVKVLPIIIFFGACTSLLFYWGIIQRCVGAASFVMLPLLETSGAETLCAIANSFLGQTESPLLIRNYLRGMTKSELFVVMVTGMATISGSILVVFAAMGVPAEHLLASCVMSIPAAIMLAKIVYPETEQPETAGGVAVHVESTASNAFDAIATGTSDGMQLALNVGAMLIAFLALLAMINFGLTAVSGKFNELLALMGTSAQMPPLTLDLIFSYVCAPFGYLLGFTGNEALVAGKLLGTKVAVNELIAYGDLVALDLPERTVDIMTYALCGFSNFSCIGIQVGGIGALVPEKRGWLTELGVYAVLCGALSNVLTAMVASLLI